MLDAGGLPSRPRIDTPNAGERRLRHCLVVRPRLVCRAAAARRRVERLHFLISVEQEAIRAFRGNAFGYDSGRNADIGSIALWSARLPLFA